MANTKNSPKASFPIWKAWKGKGAAAIFEYTEGQFYLRFIPEKGDESGFDAKASIPFQLGLNDIGEMFTVLDGIKEGIGNFDSEKKMWSGLFHKSSKNEKWFTRVGMNKTDRGLMLSVYRKNDGEQKMSVGLSIGEACMLKRFFESYLPGCFVSKWKPNTDTGETVEKTVVASEEDYPF